MSSGNSYICPGSRDYVTTKDQIGEKIQLQKVMLMFTVHDLYLNFIEEYKGKLEILSKFSYFAAAKPVQCIVAGDPGSHRFCVCAEHENIKLRLLALKNNVQYRDVLEKLVCNSKNIDCMLHRCEKCPGLLKAEEIIEKNVPKDKSTISYQFWVEDGSRASLQTLESSVKHFSEELSNDIWNLTIHHFIAQEQKFF